MRDQCANLHAKWNLAEFRDRFPELRLTHLRDCGIQFEGELKFRAAKDGYEEIQDVYQIRGIIPAHFPEDYAQVYEIGGRIPRDYHKLDNGSLCLGSEIRIKMETSKEPTLTALVDRLVIPYLYNFSYYQQKESLPVGEIDHGLPGLIQDYESLFHLKGALQCVEALRLLGLKKRVANKKPCPCGGGKRLGKCHCQKLNPLRKVASRSFFKEYAENLAEKVKARPK